MMILIKNKAYSFWFGLIVFMTLFPTLRCLILGSQGADTIMGYLLAGLPDLLLLCVIPLFFFTNALTSKFQIPKLSLLDKSLLGLFILNVAIGMIASRDLIPIVYGFRLTYLPILCYFAGRSFNTSSALEKLSKTYDNIINWLFIITLAGLVIYYFLPDLENYLNSITGANYKEYFIKRMNSLFYSPISNGAFMAFCAVYLSTRSKPLLQLSDSRLVFFFMSLLLSMSRGGIIGYLATFIFATIKNKIYKRAAIILGVVIFTTSFTSKSVRLSATNLRWIFSSAANTVELGEHVTRVELWQRAYHYLQEKPLGYGMGKSGWIAYRFYKDSDEKTAYLATDGWYLKIANETGIIGLLSFLAFFMLCFIRFYKIASRDGPHLLNFILLFLVMVCLINVVSNVLDYFLLNSMFWFAMGNGESYHELINKKNKL